MYVECTTETKKGHQSSVEISNVIFCVVMSEFHWFNINIVIIVLYQAHNKIKIKFSVSVNIHKCNNSTIILLSFNHCSLLSIKTKSKNM